MEILKAVPVTNLAWWSVLAIIIGLGSFCVLLVDLVDCRFNVLKIVVFSFILCLCIIVFIFLPKMRETGDMTYTVEITDNGQYQKLIDEGYEFKKLYNNRDIYEIQGKPIDGKEPE